MAAECQCSGGTGARYGLKEDTWATPRLGVLRAELTIPVRRGPDAFSFSVGINSHSDQHMVSAYFGLSSVRAWGALRAAPARGELSCRPAQHHVIVKTMPLLLALGLFTLAFLYLITLQANDVGIIVLIS